jgi:hypothetical protein
LQGVTLGEMASLIIAYSDLKVVESITHAINANLPKTGPLGTIPASTRPLDPRPRLKSTPTKEYRLRQVLRPETTIIASRHVQHPVDRFEPSHEQPVVTQPGVVEAHNKAKSPFLPPWATLPPVRPVKTEQVVKVVHQKVDLQSRGTVLDIFV